MYQNDNSRQNLEDQLIVLREKLKKLERERAASGDDERILGLEADFDKEFDELQEKIILQDRLAFLGQMAASIGHEVLNPLGVMKNSAYFLKMIVSPDDEKIIKHINIIEREIERARKIVTDLLNLTSTAPRQMEEVDLAKLMDEATQLIEVPGNIEVRRAYEVNVNKVLCDRDQMVQVFVNLLINAVQSIADRESPRIILSVYMAEDSVVSELSDNGPGIPEGDLERIFEPLMSSKTVGFGLGLTVCRQLVYINGGSIEARNSEDRGAVFTVSFPFHVNRETGHKNGDYGS